MSIVKLRKVFRRKISVGLGRRRLSLGSPMEIVFWTIVLIFLVGAYQYFGGPSGGTRADTQKAQRKVSKNVAIVNGHVITREEFERLYIPRARDIPSAELVTQDRQLKLGLLNAMIERLLMLDAAKKEGVSASRADINRKLDELVQQEMNRRFPTRKALARHLKRENKTADQLKAELRARISEDRQQLTETVLFEKLENVVKARVQVSDQDLQDNYARVKARHILIMPSRLKQADDEEFKAKQAAEGANAERTTPPDKDYKALAKQKAEELLARIKKGEDFATLAKEYSHDTTSAERGGMLQSMRPPAPDSEKKTPDEFFGRNEMVPEFDKAAFALKPGEVSDVVETSYGFHIIQVLDRKVELPKDFNEKKEQYRTQLLEQRKNEAWAQYTKDLRKNATIQVEDPELAAYRALEEDKKAEALALLNKAVENDPQNTGAKYQLALLLKDTPDKDRAVKLLQELAESDTASACPDVHMQLGRIYLEQKKNKEAVEAFKAASEWAQSYEYPSFFLHQELKSKFEELGEKKLAEQEQAWIDEFTKHQEEQGGGMGMRMPLTVTPQGSK